MSISLLDLSPEVHFHILHFLTLADLLRLQLVHPQFRKMIKNIHLMDWYLPHISVFLDHSLFFLLNKRFVITGNFVAYGMARSLDYGEIDYGEKELIIVTNHSKIPIKLKWYLRRQGYISSNCESIQFHKGKVTKFRSQLEGNIKLLCSPLN
jgi:hypothetical protein